MEFAASAANLFFAASVGASQKTWAVEIAAPPRSSGNDDHAQSAC
jgi:hypothetical protein